MLRLIVSLLLGFTIMWGLMGTQKAWSHDKPSAWFCFMARSAVAVSGSEAAAEKAARDRGTSEAAIAKAKQCKR